MSKEYVGLYNDSLGEFLDMFSQTFNLDTVEIKERYHYVYSKKLTGYMLFVKDMYSSDKIDTNVKFTETSKMISKTWKELEKNLKKEYNDKALAMNNKNKKKKEPVKVIVVEEVKPTIDYDGMLDDMELTEFEKDGKKYIKDVFNNIIEIKNSEGFYIGYIKDEELFFY